MIDPNLICFRCMSKLLSPGAPCPHCGAFGSELHNQANQLPVGSILAGKYLVGCTLGQGGFGITYIGWELNLNSKLAIKEYYPEGFVSRDNTNQSTVLPLSGERGAFFQNGRAKFVEEARILAQFSADPGIVSVHDFFNENGTAYIVMDFVDGQTLKQLAAERGGKLPAQEVLRYLLPVMDSLARIHASGLLHRDISPDNIIIRSSDDRAVLLDFGAARQISAMGEHSNTINVKHGYAPEEQYRTRGKQGPWTDIYALCATIYRLTTGVNLLPANDRIGPDGDTLTPISCFNVDLTSAQKAAIAQGLSVWGKDRQQSVEELKRSLIAPPSARKPKAGEKTKPERESKTDAAPQDAQPGSQPEGTAGSDQKRRRKWLLPATAAVAAVAVAMSVLPLSKLKADRQTAAVAGTDTAVTEFPTATPYSLTFEEFGKQFIYSKVENGGIRIDYYWGTDVTEDIVIPMYVEDQTVVAINRDAFFYRGDKVTTVKLPQSVTSIGDGAFNGCEALTSIEMPGVATIGNAAFQGCTLLNSVNMPMVEQIGTHAFAGCYSLTIHCPSGSYAETYAKENGLKYKSYGAS